MPAHLLQFVPQILDLAVDKVNALQFTMPSLQALVEQFQVQAPLTSFNISSTAVALDSVEFDSSRS